MGAVLNSSNSYPGYRGILKDETATIAAVLRERGYNTAAFGKWHLTPAWETSPSGPFDRWPTGRGFEKFYGFLGGETDQFEPTLYEGTTPIHRPEGDDYHVTQDLVDQAVRWTRVQHSVTPDKPFFMYFATGAAHAPLQVPKQWIERYKGKFSQGWDEMRKEIFERQKELGVIPADTALTPRPQELPARDSMSKDEQRVASRLMETYAAFLAHTDAQIGRLVQSLKDSGQYDNTLFFYIVGDNGSSAEGGLRGSINYMGALQGLQDSTQIQLKRLDDIGSASSYAQYPAGWAWALTTPFQWVKQVASHLGGIRNPLVVTWPAKISDTGALRSQFSHVNDIATTILEAAGLSMPDKVNGAAQLPLDGSSLLPSMRDGKAAEHHRSQYFEVHGHRAMYKDGWIASARHDRLPWTVGVRMGPTPFEDDVWELYDLDSDFSQAHDLAKEKPVKLRELQALFQQKAEDLGILPLRSSVDSRTPMPSLVGQRSRFTYYPGAVGIPEGGAANIANHSWNLTADLSIEKAQRAGGVIATMGGSAAGWSLYVDADGKPVFEYRVFELGHIRLEGAEPLHSGSQTLRVEFDYDGGGYAKGGNFSLHQSGGTVAKGRVEATPPAYFSIDETFDVGTDTGSAAGAYPKDAALGYPFAGGTIEKVLIEVH